MIRRRLAWGILSLWLASCAADGGTSGTGISGGESGTAGSGSPAERVGHPLTTVEGRIADLREAKVGHSRAPLLARTIGAFSPLAGQAVARGGVEGVRVAAEGTDLADTSDAEGAFTLSGELAESVTLVFSRAGDPREARMPILTPTGSRSTLDDVVVDLASGRARAAQSVRFEGTVVDTDCPGGRVYVTSSARPDGTVFTVHDRGLWALSSPGHELTCHDLEPGDRVIIDGVVKGGGTIEPR